MQLYSYALHGSSVLVEKGSGVSLDKEKGYTAYFFDLADDSEVNVCILHLAYQFRMQRVLLHVSQSILTIFLACSIPLCLVALYDIICEQLTDSKKLQYFLWAAIVASFFVNTIVVGVNLTGIIKQGGIVFRSSWFFDTKIYYGAYSGMLLLTLLIDISFTGIGVIYIKRRRQHIAIEGSPQPEIPIPALVGLIASKLPFPCCGKCIGDPDSNNRRCPVSECSKYGIQFVGAISLAYFLQLFAFHSIYIIMGIIAAPVEAGSIFWFYISIVLCFVAFIAVVLKATDRDFSEYRCTLRHCGKCLLYCIVPVLIVFLFVAFAVTFIVFIYLYTLLVQVYTSSKGVVSFIGAILPSVTLTILGCAGTRIVRCIKGKRLVTDDVNSANQPGSNEVDVAAEQQDSQPPGTSTIRVTDTGTRKQQQKQASVDNQNTDDTDEEQGGDDEAEPLLNRQCDSVNYDVT